MPVRIEVTAYNGVPPASPLAAEFDELGGTIGRGEGSTLTLPDPERHISRTHARVVFRAGDVFIQDRGSATPVHVNGRQVGNGNEAAIGDGDEIQIGGYVLRARLENASTSTIAGAVGNPTLRRGGHLDGLAGTTPSDAGPLGNFMEAQTPANATPSAQPPLADPFDVLPRQPSDAERAGVIPADFDPFADPLAPEPDRAPLPDDLNLGWDAAGDQRMEDLFRPDSPSDPLGPAQPLTSEGELPSDPLQALGLEKAPPAQYQPAQRDDTPELHGSLSPPRARPDTMVLSWEDPQQVAPAAPGAGPSRPVPSAAQPQGGPAVGAPAAASPDARVPAATADPELLQAFLRGAGVPDLAIPGGLTPQWMYLLGQVTREAVQGTLDLLLARALTKREVRAEATMIVAGENNPLKFSPNVEAALMHLLGPTGRGFMPPNRALRDAYDDLRSHQFGFMAGMRAALGGVLQRFDPQKLEQRLTQQRVLDAVLPMYRKAGLWELFAELYGEISKEAEDDFHTLFGREFLRAYQAQIARLREADGQSGD